MDSIRSHTLVRHGLLTALIATGIYVAPSLFAADGNMLGINLFQHLSVLFTIVLAFAALRVDDRELRGKLVLSVTLGFALLAAFILSFSMESLVLFGLAMSVSVMEWPQHGAGARAY